MDSKSDIESENIDLNVFFSMIQSKTLLHGVIDSSKEIFNTVLIDMDRPRGQLYFDASQNTRINNQILKSFTIDFSGTFNGAKFNFSVYGVEKCLFKNTPAFSTAIPSKLNHQQQRTLVRLSAQNIWCIVPIRGAGLIKIRVLDINTNGLLLSLRNAPNAFYLNENIAGCQLLLGDTIRILCSLEIRRIKLLPDRSTGCGCHFLNLGLEQKNQLLRYLQQSD